MPVLELKKQEKDIKFQTLKPIKSETTQKRCYIAELIRKALDKYLDFDDLSAQNTYSIYTLPIVNDELDVIDFEINSLSIHVIPTIDKAKNLNVYIPAIYKQLNYKPDMFIFVNFTKALSKMDIIGFINKIDYTNLSIPKTILNSADNIIEALQTQQPQESQFGSNIENTVQELMLAYIDNELSEEGKRFFLKYLLANKEIRKSYKLFYSFNCNFVSIAKNSNFEKIQPQEQQDTKIEPKIESFNRSSFIIDAIEPNSQEISSQKEQQEPEINEEESFELIDMNEQAEENLEQLTDSTNFGYQEEQENNEFALNDTQEESIENSINNEEEDLNDNQEQNENEDSVITDINEEPQELPPTDIISNLDEESDFTDDLLSTDESDNLLEKLDADETDEDFLQLIQDAPLDILDEQEDELSISENNKDEETTTQEQEINTEPEKLNTQEQEESSPEELSEESTEDDDLFSILSEIANETENEAEIQEVPEADETTNTEIPKEKIEESINNSSPENINEPINSNETNESEKIITPSDTPAYNKDSIQELNVSFNNETPSIMNFTQPQSPKSTKNSSAKVLIATLLLVGIGLYGTYTYKDKIISKLGLADKVENLSEKDLLPPPPIPNTEDNNIADAQAQNPQDDKIAPAPTEIAAENNTTAEKVTQKSADEQIPPKPSTAETLPNLPSTTTVEPPKPKNINDALANALTKDFNGVRISKISWEISETLVDNPEVKRYLTIAGKSIKNSLAQDLMSATEMSFKDTIIVNITYRKDGSVAKTTIENSSGSKQIDNIVLKTLKDTFNYVKMPPLNINKPEYNAKLIIRL